MLAYKAGQYKQALGLLLKFRARSETRYGGTTGESTGESTGEFDNRDELLGLLVTTYCRLREWTQAEEIVRTMEFEGRGEAVKTLVWCYCEEKKWTEGERILCLTQTQTQTPLPSDLPLRNTSDFQDSGGPDIETMEMFAEVYRGQGDYDKAIKMCDGILQSVQDEECIQFYLAISALGQIYELKGDIIEATLHKDLLPPGIEGNRLPRSLSPVRSFTSFTFPSSPFPHLLMHLRMWTDA
jgi:tetratricopeptide (TPR) repeat protein